MSKLIFVYNADSGVLNSLKDWAHKIISPKTYACNLCALTYNTLGMRHAWREFVNGLGYEVEFLHRNELAEQFDIKNVQLPAAFIFQDNELKLWIKCDVMDALNSLDELQTLVTQKLAQETG